jgi:hypothetical protein
MRERKISKVAVVPAICCAFFLLPLTGQGADLVIGSNVSTSGDWSLHGIVTANSFSGSGSGLTNVTASNLVCNGCVSQSALSFIPGTITGINAGAGLTGGGNTGIVPIAVNFGGSGASSAVSRSDHNHDSLYQRKYGKVAIVAQDGGDYTDPYAVMVDSDNWCGIASETNPCLVKIMPGIYDVGGNSVQMKSYIDIEGSGENTTKIKGNISANDSGVVRGAAFAELRFLSVENTGGGGADAIAMYNYQAAPKITNVTLTARNAGNNSTALYNTTWSLPILINVTLEGFNAAKSSYGIYSTNLCNPQLTNVKIKTQNAYYSIGVASYSNVVTTMNNVTIESIGNSSVNGALISSSTMLMTNSSIRCTVSTSTKTYCLATYYNSTINLSNSSIEVTGGETYALYNSDSSTVNVTNSSITATGTSPNYSIGVINYSSSTLRFENTSIEAKSGISNIGVQNASSGGNVTIDHSTITGTQTSIRNDSSTATFRVGASKIDGPAEGNTLCVSSYNGSYAPVGTNCL